jgi:mannan endo-1,4-beta-mannosidase
MRGARRSARGGILEQYVEHGEQAQRSRRGLIAPCSRKLVRKAGWVHWSSMKQFVRREGARLMLGDSEFRIVGANNYYAAYVDEPVARSLFELASSAHMNVMRIWAFWERANNSPHYFQSWDAGRADYSEAGLRGLDRAVALAEEHGMRVILTLANNWKDFGGVPAYLRWFGLSSHEQFYRDGRCRAAYWLWVQQLLERTNTANGRVYKDDPTILAWELGNEFRCPDVRDGRDLLLSWIWEMATLLKANAPHHLVAVGDEGFFHRSGAGGNTLFNGSHGADFEAILGVDPVDFGTYHMYGDWAKGGDLVKFGEMWIREHIEAAGRANKPVLLEEYGAGTDDLPVPRADVYAQWLKVVELFGSLGDLVWMLGLPKGPGQPYAPDAYVIHEGPELDVVRRHAQTLCGSELS